MSTKTYRVRGIDLDHDGERFPEGSEIELDDKAAAKLGRWLEPVAPAEPPKTANTKKTDGGKSAEGNGQTTGQAEGGKQ